MASWPFKKRSTISLQDYLSWLNYAGHLYPVTGLNQTLQGDREEISADFSGYAQTFMLNPVVQACIDVRRSLFSEARFQYRRRESGRPTDPFGNESLSVLEQPWPGGTTGDLLSRMILDADLAGNFYGVRQGAELIRLRPDYVSIVLGERPGRDLGYAKAGYLYWPEGRHGGAEAVALRLEEVAHFAPRPDPIASYRGISWISACLKEILADNAACSHKLKFWEQGATVNLAIKLDASISKETFDAWVAAFKDQHVGAENAYKTLFLGGGADPVPLGSTFEQADFKVVQGAGETRIAAAAGVPPVIAGLSEGLEAATYSNYQQSIRRFADITMRPLWREAADSLSQVVDVPTGATLWYDDRDIPALAENLKDLAEIQRAKASTLQILLNSGWEPESALAAVEADDFRKLQHSGLLSVQLQPPMTELPEPTPNGEVPAELADVPTS